MSAFHTQEEKVFLLILRLPYKLHKQDIVCRQISRGMQEPTERGKVLKLDHSDSCKVVVLIIHMF